MNSFYTADMFRYVEPERLPLWVEYVPYGHHDERLFHNHKFSEIALVLHGRAIHLTPNASSEINAGDVLVLHPGISHAYDNTGDMELINIVYDQKKLSLPILDGYSLPMFHYFFPVNKHPADHDPVKPVMTLNEQELKDVSAMIRHMESELKNFLPGNFFLSLALFMEIIVMLSRHNNNMTAEHRFRFQIGEVINYMNNHLKNSIEVDDIVVISRMSRRNLFRKFRQSTGYTPIEYLLRIRMQKAVELLLRSNLTINEIATECGFCDSNYLCRMFKQHFNTSPRRFRIEQLKMTEDM